MKKTALIFCISFIQRLRRLAGKSMFTLCGAMMVAVLAQGPVLAAESAPPDPEAKAAVLMDYRTGRILWEKNAQLPLSMASTTKIMTAVLALENGNPSDMVTVSKNASLAPDVQLNLAAGEEIKLNDLLHALMMVSANDAAVAIAEHIGGDVDSFCAMMTEKARDLGAMDTVFETPNGLDKGDHHSTAYDLAVIARYALRNPSFVELINTKSVAITSNKRTYSLNNTNRLLYGFDGGNGIKTGFTGKAGHCFVGAAKRGDMQLISVVLASGWGNRGKEQKWTDSRSLLNYGFQNYHYEQIIQEGLTAGHIAVERSKTDTLGYSYADSVLLPINETEKNSIHVDIVAPQEMKAPIHKGETVGTAIVTIDGRKCAEVPLYAETGADRHDLKTSLEKVIASWLSLSTTTDIELVLPEF